MKESIFGLSDKQEIQLTMCEVLLDTKMKLVNKEFDEWMNSLIERNGTTEY